MTNRAAMSLWSCLSLKREAKNHLSSEDNPLHLSCFSFASWEYFYKLFQPTRDKTEHREVVRLASDNGVKMSCGYRTMCGNHVKILRQMMCFVLTGLVINTTGTANNYVWQYLCSPWLYFQNSLWFQIGPQHFSSVSLVISKTCPSSYSSDIITKVHSKIY